MKFKNLSDSELENLLKKSSEQERKLTCEIIDLLAEVDRRKIYLEKAYGSLIEYCIKELKYSESAAYRRVSAMRVSREIPETKQALLSGALSLASVARAQSVFNSQKKLNKPVAVEMKRELLSEIQNKSSREADKILVALFPEAATKREEVRAVSTGQNQLTLLLSDELLEKLEKLKNILSHRKEGAGFAALIEHLTELGLKKYDKCAQNKSDAAEQKTTDVVAQSNTTVIARHNTTAVAPRSIPESTSDGIVEKGPSTGARKIAQLTCAGRKSSRYISAQVKRQVWQESSAMCSYVNKATGRRCTSQKYLEIDHVQALARGGSGTAENLQLLCDAHNRWKSDLS